MNDLISRGALINDLSYCAPELFFDKDYLITKIMKQPAVDAAPVVHAWWVDEAGNPVPWSDNLPASPAQSCWCNQCHTWLTASDEYPVIGLFCPACGARMDGGDADESK